MDNINPVIINLLNNRGIVSENDIAEFLSAKPQKTYDPFLLLNMEDGVDLILRTIEKGEKICIYGDYDADGITSTSLMMKALSHLTDNVDYYIPSRFDEGYGLNMSAIEKIYNDGVGLIITVDCGSVSHAEVEYAKSLGIKVIITDHHNITDVIADCIVINPKQPDCEYPFKQLAGVGVAFKLVQALQRESDLPKSVLKELLDLVAIGTIADVVPLVDENRTLVKYGLNELNKLERKGLKALVGAIYKRSEEITSENVAYIIAPHLNAVGRMLSADVAVELLISEDEVIISENVNKLIESNNERKRIQEKIYIDCEEIVEKHLSDKKFFLICVPDAHEGITGIVAGNIKEKYNRPTVVMTKSGVHHKGTGRSIKAINLYELLNNFKELFVKFGGHSGACGFSMQEENLQALKRGLEEKANEMYEAHPEMFEEQFDFDMEITGQDVTILLGELVSSLAPFGHQNEKPIFCIKNVTISNVSFMGNEGTHLRFTSNCNDGTLLQCVLFQKAKDYQEIVMSGEPVNLFGSIEVSTWNETKRIQFITLKITSCENQE